MVLLLLKKNKKEEIMAKDYSLPDYDKYRQWIIQTRNKQGRISFQ